MPAYLTEIIRKWLIGMIHAYCNLKQKQQMQWFIGLSDIKVAGWIFSIVRILDPFLYPYFIS